MGHRPPRCGRTADTADEHGLLLARRVGEALRDAGASHTAGVQAPQPALLDAVREASPDVLTLVADPDLDAAVRAARAHGEAGVAVGLEDLQEEWMEAAEDARLLVDVFVVNAPVDLAVAVYYGADVLETDRVTAVLDSFDD